MRQYDFDRLFILDVANNHQGDLAHGLRIVREHASVAKEAGVRAGIKFQFRDLDTLIHPDFRTNPDVPHIPRFLSTRLSRDDYALLVEEVRSQGLIALATPFDERSVDLALELGIEILKVASCSANDQPLLEKIAEANRPVIVSTGGLSLINLDSLVGFLDYHRVDYALMHCVAIYPTPANSLNLNQIEHLRSRYPNAPVGFSTHEPPDNLSAIGVAHAKGARLFERHVGVETEQYKLNAYSSTPAQIATWIKAYQEALVMCGGDHRSPAHPDEIKSLRSLMRGAYAKNPIAKGQRLKRSDIYFAMPLQSGQLSSAEWQENMLADADVGADQPVAASPVASEMPEAEIVYQVMLQVKGMLNTARVFVDENASMEISHHYGLRRFREFGCVIVSSVNRSYCKKLIIQLPRQRHPYHYHEKKEETFQLLSGDLEVELDGHTHQMKLGGIVLVRPGQWHKFHTLHGAIFEEISSTHFDDDSFYDDPRIARIPRERRKTSVPSIAPETRAAGKFGELESS